MQTPASAEPPAAPAGSGASRVAWVDYAKGLCILLVVMFHTVTHWQAQGGDAGWVGAIVDWSKPFRMPDFFLISGLFLSRTIDGPLKTFLDRKVLHFVYFYLLWLLVTQLANEWQVLLADPAAWAGAYGWNILQPVGSLWFVHMLAVFYVLTRLTRRLPKWLVLAAAASLQIAHQGAWVDTPSFALNRLMEYYVFFFLGYSLSGLVFEMADKVKQRRAQVLAVILAWGFANALLVDMGLHHIGGYGLMLGLAGAVAVIQASVLLSQFKWTGFLRYCGQNSIVIYLTFYFPMMALLKLAHAAPGIDGGLLTAGIVMISAATPLAFHLAIRNTPLRMLYERPDWFRLKGVAPKKSALAAA